MPITSFKDKLIARLENERIRKPERMLNETYFEQKFVLPIASEISRTETDVFLFSHPWGKRIRCAPDCGSAREGKGRIQEGCDKCWKESKGWATVNAFGTQNNFDLVAQDTSNCKLAVEIKLVSFTKGRRPNGEIQRFLGQCALATTRFDFVVGVCAYSGMINLGYDLDTEGFKHWAGENKINIVFRSLSTKPFANYDIEWIEIPSFKFKRSSGEFYYNDRHGVQLYYRDEGRDFHVGFIDGYRWYHTKQGPVRIYTLSKDSKEWAALLPKSKKILNEVKAAVHEVLTQQPFEGGMKGNIYSQFNK